LVGHWSGRGAPAAHAAEREHRREHEHDQRQQWVQSADPAVAAGERDMLPAGATPEIDLTRVDTPAGRLYVKGNFEHVTHEFVDPNRLRNMTELPDPEVEKEEAPAPAPVKVPVKVAASAGPMSKKDKRKAKQRAEAEALAEAEAEPEPAPAPVAPKVIAKPTHGWRVKLKTIAPDGPAADAYTRDELMEIKAALGR
jgi:hypothetical protein